MPPTAFVPYIVLGQEIFILLSQLLITLPCVFFLFKYYINRSYSLILRIFLVYLVIFAIAAIINSLYLIIFWSPTNNLYNFQILCLLGFCQWALIFPCHIIEFFIGFERCMVLTLRFSYTEFTRKLIGFASILIVFIYGVGITLLEKLPVFPTNISTTTNCKFYDCVLDSQPIVYMRNATYFIVSLNLSCGILLLFLIKFICKKYQQNDYYLYRGAIITIITTGFLGWFPKVITALSYLVLDYPLSSIAGPLRSTVAAFNVSVIALIYVSVFRRKPRKENNNVKISAVNVISYR